MWIHTGKSCRKSCRILAPTSKLGATRSAEFFFFFITLGLELSDTKVYEPYIRPLLGLLRNTAEQLFSNRELYRSVQLSIEEFS